MLFIKVESGKIRMCTKLISFVDISAHIALHASWSWLICDRLVGKVC